MLRRKPVLILANLALAALVSGFTCVQINTPQGQLSTNGRLYAFQTPDNNLYCGLVDVFQLRDTKGDVQMQFTDDSSNGQITRRFRPFSNNPPNPIPDCFSGGGTPVNANVVGQASCKLNSPKGAGQGRLQDKSSGKSYPIQTNDGVDCQSLNQGSP